MGQEEAFANMVSSGSVTTEEGTIIGRVRQPFDIPESMGAAKVNGPTGDKGQYVWMGMYTVKLDRGLSLDKVPHLCLFGGLGNQTMRCLAYGERVSVTWLNKSNTQIPIILEGTTLDFYSKILSGNGTLLDPGEYIVRSAMAPSPGAAGDYPFADNQFDNPNSTPAGGKQDAAKTVSAPGAESFYDKFGRIVSLSRTPGREFLITHGRVDTGQDDTSSLPTVSAQDTYYAKIISDEAEPLVKSEPFAPKPINLAQYQLKKVSCKIEGDPDPTRTVVKGILPRFDKWKFNPIVIRKYTVDTDGTPETGETYSEYQERGNSEPDATVLGYLRTVTTKGDIKEFIPRHYNGRIVGDHLLSIGGNYELKVKTTALMPDGTENTNVLAHQEYLADGTIRMRVGEDLKNKKTLFDSTISPDGTYQILITEDTSAKTATFSSTVLPDGTSTILIKAGGGTASDYNLKIMCAPDGTYTIDTKKDLVITSQSGGKANITIDGDVSLTTNGKTTVTSKGDVSVTTQGKADITATGDCSVKAPNVSITGGNLTVNGTVAPTPGNGPFCALPACLFTGAPHIGNKVAGT